MERVCRLLSMERLHTSLYHPQTDGLVECRNWTLIEMLSMYVSADLRDWDRYVPYVVLAYRTSLHDSITCTPFFMQHGRKARLPIDLDLPADEQCPAEEAYAQTVRDSLLRAWEAARVSNQLAQAKQKRYYDRRASESSLTVGQYVYVYTPRPRKGRSPKLQHLWHGPLRIAARSDTNVTVVDDDQEEPTPQTVHINRCKRAWLRQPPLPASSTPDDHPALSTEEPLPSDDHLAHSTEEHLPSNDHSAHSTEGHIPDADADSDHDTGSPTQTGAQHAPTAPVIPLQANLHRRLRTADERRPNTRFIDP